MRIVNMTDKNRHYAVFTPALSGFYVHYISKQQHFDYVPKERIPAKFENGIEGMNFLNADKGYFHYGFALYSAGHAQLDIQKAMEAEGMVHNRDPNTLIIGDSGGFQISKGVWQGNWLSPEGQCSKTDEKRGKVLNWLENTADYSMFLDIPTAGLSFLDEKTGKPRCGLNNYAEFRDATIENNKYFFKRLQGKTKFINVCQGTTYEEADDWFEKVCKPIEQYTKGWAFGGVQKTNVNHSLRRLLMCKDLGMLGADRAEWIHFLGTGRCDHGVIYTAMQDAIRNHVNPYMTISFDCASPFIAVANGQVYTHNVFTNKRFSYVMDKMDDDKPPANKDEPWPWDMSPVGERLTWKDVNYYNPGDLNKNGKEGATSWDSFAYALMMGHNIYQHIDAVQMANRLAARQTTQMITWMPKEYLEFRDLVDDLFSKDYNANQKAIDAELAKHAKLFEKVSKTKHLRVGNTFNSLFEEEDGTDYSDDAFAEDTGGKLEALEQSEMEA